MLGRLDFLCSLPSLGAEDVASAFHSGWKKHRTWIQSVEMGFLGETGRKGERKGNMGRFSGWRGQSSILKVEVARASKSRSLPAPAPGTSSQVVRGLEVSLAGKGALVWMSIGSLRG